MKRAKGNYEVKKPHIRQLGLNQREYKYFCCLRVDGYVDPNKVGYGQTPWNAYDNFRWKQ